MKKVNWKLVITFIALAIACIILFSCKKENPQPNVSSLHNDTARLKIEVVDWGSNTQSFWGSFSSYSPSDSTVFYLAESQNFIFSGVEEILDTTFIFSKNDDLVDKEFYVSGIATSINTSQAPDAVIRYKVYFNDELKDVIETSDYINQLFVFN